MFRSCCFEQDASEGQAESLRSEAGTEGLVRYFLLSRRLNGLRIHGGRPLLQ